LSHDLGKSLDFHQYERELGVEVNLSSDELNEYLIIALKDACKTHLAEIQSSYIVANVIFATFDNSYIFEKQFENEHGEKFIFHFEGKTNLNRIYEYVFDDNTKTGHAFIYFLPHVYIIHDGKKVFYPYIEIYVSFYLFLV
jgi:hypothetical protein